MTGKVIAVANMKGGVGKTTIVVALAEALAAENKSVLVIDADAQANASICIAGDILLTSLIHSGHTVDAFLDDFLIGGRKIQFSDCILRQASGVSHCGTTLPISLLASSSELRLLEREIIFKLTAEKYGLDAIVGRIFLVLKEQLGARALLQNYDYVIVDCAPGISALTEASIRLADLVIVPTIPDYLSSYGLKSFCKIIWDSRPPGSLMRRPKRPPRVLMTRKREVNEHRRIAKALRDDSRTGAFELFETEIPERIGIAESLKTNGAYPTFTTKWGTNVPLLNSLAQETMEALHGA